MANKIRQSNLDTSVITGNTELSETMNVNDVLLIYDQTAGTLKKVTRANLLGAPTVSSVSPTSVVSGDGTGNYTFTITGTDFAGAATAQLLTSGGSPVNFDTVTRDSSTQITGVIAKSSLTNANEPYGVRVDNGNGTTDDLTGQINIDAQPAFTTAAGSLGFFSQGAAVSVSVNATDPESAGNVTFELQSGTLPPGFTITNNAADGGTAVISGTAPTGLGSTTVYNFVIRAADAASNTSSRAFSISVVAPTSESFTSSGTFSVPSYVSSVDVLVVAGGGGGGWSMGGGGGAGGLIFVPCYPVTPSGTVSVTVGCGGVAPCSPGPTASYVGQDSSFGTLTAKGGGGGGAAQNACYSGGGTGGSGGGAGRDAGSRYGTPNFGVAIQPTQPGQSGAYGFGSNGGSNPTAPDFVGSAGGGGAGAVGANGSGSGSQGDEDGGDGGIGKAYTIADGTTPVYYAGGGGGSFYCFSGKGITVGGQGGGGDGYKRAPSTPAREYATDGQANKGGGGGGGSKGPGLDSGNGGKGIVIVRY